jgi:carboxypeptidase Q
MIPISRILTGALLASVAAIAPAQADPQTIERILDEGKNRNQVMRFIRHLAVDIGPRLTGSPGLVRAEQYAMAEFRRMGVDDVRLEQWGEVPVGFARGPLQVARMVEPYPTDMVFTIPAWSNGTNGLIRAEAAWVPRTLDDLNTQRGSLASKWLVMPAGVRVPAEVTAELDKMAVHGIVSSSGSELVRTGGSWRGKTYENRPTEKPRVTVRKSDYDRIARNLDWNRKVVLEIGADHRWIKGPIPQYNVVAEIRGSERPDEIVVISGHVDSWDGPGTQGASDNATGVSAVLEAARILTKVGARPKRTIQFVLWGGEEQGLLGSRAFVERHRDKLDKISAVLVDDGGTNYQGGWVILESMRPFFEAAVEPMHRAFPDHPQILRVVDALPRGGGSDHVPFNAVGVPGFFSIETGRANYPFIHHTQHDRIEHVIPEYMVQSSTNFAVTAYVLASAPSLLPRR